ACMHKLLTILNAMLKHRTPWQPQEVQSSKNIQGPLDNQDSGSAPASLRPLAAPEARRSAVTATREKRKERPQRRLRMCAALQGARHERHAQECPWDVPAGHGPTWGACCIGGLVLLALSVLLAPLTITAQQRGKIPIVGVLWPGYSPDP